MKDIRQNQRDIFSKNLKKQAIIRGKTQADISADLGVWSSTVSGWFIGTTNKPNELFI